MNTPNEPAGPAENVYRTPESAAAPPRELNPDDPHWGVLGGIGMWLSSLALMVACVVAVLFPYLFRRGVLGQDMEEFVTEDPTAILLQTVSLIPAHILTLGVAWLIVTGAGKRPFFRSLGWQWGRGFTLWRSAALAVGLLVVGLTVIYLAGSPETPLDKMLKSSRAAALVTAFLATFTAPFVEEVVYRGVLFSGLRKHLGAAWAGLFVIVLFALVHVPQYKTSPGTIFIILLLSTALTVIRARTGQLLPCFVVHLIFNGIQSLIIVAEPYLERFAPQAPPVPAPDPALLLQLAGLFG